MIIRLAIYLVALLFMLCVAALIADFVKGWARRRAGAPRRPASPTRPARLPRRSAPALERGEDRDRIVHFVESRSGVEAYVEPRTMMHPLSVVLVATDGEWIRVALNDERFLHELAQSRGVPIYDAMATGYPERMRTYRRPGSGDGENG
jgi:hypothetical protein